MVGLIKSHDGVTYAGNHLLIDIWLEDNKLSSERILSILTEGCLAAKATILFSHAHEFEPEGSSGVIILAESHCTYHYWPEDDFIAIDLFVCGDSDPRNAIPVFEREFDIKMMKIKNEERGRSCN